MNDEELKKKICEIIAPYVSTWGEAGRIADALIAAGIRDMSDIRALADNVMLSVIAHKAEVSSMEQRAKEAEHRAERAERALKRFSENIVCEDCPFFQECTLSSKLKAVSYSQECFGEYLRQAEKELAEERKDEKLE